MGNNLQEIRKPALAKLLVTVIWLAALTLFRLRFDFSVLFLWLGGIVGTVLIEADQLVYLFADHPEEPISTQVRGLVNQKKWQEALVLITKTSGERKKLVFHTLFFQLIFQVFAFFVVSSTGSMFGIGMVLAMCLHLLVKQSPDKELRTYFVCLSLFFLFLNYLVIRS